MHWATSYLNNKNLLGKTMVSWLSDQEHWAIWENIFSQRFYVHLSQEKKTNSKILTSSLKIMISYLLRVAQLIGASTPISQSSIPSQGTYLCCGFPIWEATKCFFSLSPHPFFCLKFNKKVLGWGFKNDNNFYYLLYGSHRWNTLCALFYYLHNHPSVLTVAV